MTNSSAARKIPPAPPTPVRGSRPSAQLLARSEAGGAATRRRRARKWRRTSKSKWRETDGYLLYEEVRVARRSDARGPAEAENGRTMWPCNEVTDGRRLRRRAGDYPTDRLLSGSKDGGAHRRTITIRTT